MNFWLSGISQKNFHPHFQLILMLMLWWRTCNLFQLLFGRRNGCVQLVLLLQKLPG